MYGGRVSDSYDRRILTTYLDEYLGDFLFDAFQPFRFYACKDYEIAIPQAGARDVYLKAVEALPLVQVRVVQRGKPHGLTSLRSARNSRVICSSWPSLN